MTSEPLLILYSGLMICLAYGIAQSQFVLLAGLYGLISVIYVYKGIKNQTNPSLLLNGILKIILLAAFPQASDDIYRYFWDGQCIVNGLSPYAHTPAELMSNLQLKSPPYFDFLNSKSYYSVYPPVLQGIWALVAVFSFKSVFLFSMWWKFCLLLADWITIKCLIKWMGPGHKHIFWYAWNPLIIYELLCNAHPELLLIAPLLWSLYYTSVGHLSKSAIALACSAAIKLFPIILLLPIACHLWFSKKSMIQTIGYYVLITTTCFAASLAPIVGYISNFKASLDLYFSKFQFNGGVFELWKYLDFQRWGFDNGSSISSLLSILFIILFISLTIWLRLKSLVYTLLMIWTSYLLFQATVHPWYLGPVLVLGILSGKFYPIIWSMVVVWSYSWYDPNWQHTKYYWIALEYMFVLAAILLDHKFPDLLKLGIAKPDAIN